MSDPRYPIGKFVDLGRLTAEQRAACMEAIEQLPLQLGKAVEGLTNAQLDTPYREGGWTVRQLVHHVADSHMNAFCRFRWALTEIDPVIKPYEEQLWAELADSKLPVGISLQLLDCLHARWVVMVRALQPADFERGLVHPASGPHDIDWLVALYAWHGAHHVGHVTALRAAQGW